MPKTISLKKNTIANYIGQFYTMFIGIFMLPFYLKYLGAEAYGLVGFFTMLSAWMMLLDVGLSTTLSRETSRLKFKTDGLLEVKKILRSVEFFFIFIVVIIVSTVYISSEWIALNWLQVNELSIDTVSKCIVLMGLIIGAKWYVGLYQGLIIGLEQQIWLNIYKVVIATLRFVGGVILVVYISDDIYHFFMYQLFIALIEFIIIKNKNYKELPRTRFIKPSLESFKKIAGFAISIAYISWVWIIFTQLDKLLLSHFIPLNEYGYFALVVTVSTAIVQLSQPLSQALLPRMTTLLAENKEKQMIELYLKATRYMSILIFSVVGIVSYFSYELLFSWTGNIEASLWAKDILSLYVLGNGFLAILAFQYYLQYAHGKLKYHIRFNTVLPLIALPMIYFSVSNYGAIGAATTWFLLQIVTFLVWPPFIHFKFAKGIHSRWVFDSILPSLIVSIVFFILINYFNINVFFENRLLIFINLILFGILLLLLNFVVYKENREMILQKLKGFK